MTMKYRKISREEAEDAYTKEMSGKPFRYSAAGEGTIMGIRLPPGPLPGGAEGRLTLPLTYEYEVGGETHVMITQDGPEVNELRSFLHATIPDLAIDEMIELWFEEGGGRTLGCC